MPYFNFFSKNGRDMIIFKPEHDGDIKDIVMLENKRICNLQLRDDAIIANLEEESGNES